MAQAAVVMTGPRAGSPDASVVLRTRNLSKRYGKRLAVDNLNMEVRRGEIFGFLGPNGAGKTTTIRMALGLIAPTMGSVEVLGEDIGRHARRVLPRVGALIEQPALHTYLSGRDNLRSMARLTGGVSSARIDEVLGLVGLFGRRKDKVRTYSLGMKQRLGVGIALLSDPDLLVLDEPANGLDPAGIVEMRDLLKKLAAEGKTVFISSHVLVEVQQLCTRVAIINLGKLITESTVEDLTRGHGAFIVVLDQPEAALALIRAQHWGVDARLNEQNEIVCQAPDGRGRLLNQFLIDAGHIADRLAYQEQSLEEVFLKLTDSSQEGAHS